MWVGPWRLPRPRTTTVVMRGVRVEVVVSAAVSVCRSGEECRSVLAAARFLVAVGCQVVYSGVGVSERVL